VSAQRDKGSDLETTAEKFAELERAIEQAKIDFYKAGYEAGYKAGRDAGLKARKRRAKGKSETAKSRGRQKVLPDIWALQFFDYVESCDRRGLSPGAAAEEYRNLMASAWEDFDERGPSRAALMRLYEKMKKGTDKIDPSVRRIYKRLKRDSSST
jgi:hypothetical protein